MTNVKRLCDRESTGQTMFEIPFSQLDNGIQLCSKNIRRFIQDAELLLNDSSIPHAMALAIFAFEELGKYYGLKKAKETMKDDIVEVDERLFGPRGGHQYKQDIARRLIPSDAMPSIPAFFDSKYFDARHFRTEDVNVSPVLRLDCVFVNWKDGVWVHGSAFGPAQVRKFTNAIIDCLDRLEGQYQLSSAKKREGKGRIP